MYKFDESFLDEVGLSAMPQEQKQVFLDYAQDRLEILVGEKLTDALNDRQVEEFGRIVEGDTEFLRQAAEMNYSDYRNDELYVKLAQSGASEEEILSDFVAAKWLSVNCPNYSEIIANAMAEIKNDIITNKDAILANS